MTDSPRPRARAARRLEVVRPRRRPALGQPARRRRLDPRPGGGERRRQVDAGQDRRRRAPPRRAATSCSAASSVDFGSTADSKDAGIAVIYQEPTLFPDLSVTENIFMGRQPLGRGRRIDRAAMYAEAEGLFGRLGVDLDPRRPARGLSIADQQIIEIAKAISLDARLLIMDEPTAALSGVEVERLFAVARSLRDEGRALVFISHRFDEVFALCDTVTVMRDGAYVATRPHRGHVRRRDRRGDGRAARSPTCSPRRPPRSASRSSRSRASTAPASSTTSRFTVRARRDRRPGRARRRRPQRDRPRRLRRRRYDAGRVRLDGRRDPPTQPAAPRSTRAWPSCRRTGASRAWSPRRRWPATSPRVIRGGLARAGLLTDRRREPRGGPVGRRGSRSRPTPST